MIQYPKIDGPFMRDQTTGKVRMWQWRRPEFEALADVKWLATEKLDGMNIRVHYDPGILHLAQPSVKFAGRTDAAAIPAPLMQYLFETFPVGRFGGFDNSITLFGEGVGSKIQKGGIYGETQRFVLFDAWIGTRFMDHEELVDLSLLLSVPVAPYMGVGSLRKLIFDMFKGVKSAYAVQDVLAEGLVAVPDPVLCDKYGRRLIVKLKAKDLTV